MKQVSRFFRSWRSITLAVVLVAAFVAIGTATDLIRELRNDYRLRHALANELFGSGGSGTNSFTTTAVKDTVRIQGLASTSYVLPFVYSTSSAQPDSTDIILYHFLAADSAEFTRPDGGTSGLKYFYIVVKW